MKLLVVVALACLAFEAVVAESPVQACPAIGCLNACPLGFALKENGCPSCECCASYACHFLPCEHERDERGCPYCKCKPRLP